ncbi:MAG: GDP-mannose 4,6-dehydratase [Fimbriimonadaceae bacterium]|nr:GDP-mannose 4,6-dehydratase [Chitinophagales bacterium]
MKILITGACGMVGSHMVDVFHAQGGHDIIGTYYKPTTDLSDIAGKAKLAECDVRYYKRLLEIISSEKPERIFHLAAQSYPTVSWERPQETMDVNVNGTINVFEAVKFVRKLEADYDPVVVVACSSAEYGLSLTPENAPVKEDTALLPLHPYGVSKVAQDLLSFQYFQNDKIKTIRARIFNTTGPRKANDVVADFTMRAYQIEKGLLKKLRVGNLSTKRAITDVRDLVSALILLSEKGKWGDAYNISGNKVYEIRDIIPIIEEAIGMKVETEVDPALLRPTDEPIIYGDSTKLKNDTGWKQTYDLKTTIKDMIDYLRSKQ